MALKILAFVNKDSGSSYHRIITPMLLMPDVDCFITNKIEDSHFDKGVDIFFYSRCIEESSMADILEKKKKHGFKVILDLDDYWMLDTWHPAYSSYMSTDYKSLQVKNIKFADHVICTNPILQKHISFHNSNVEVLYNAIPKSGQFEIQKKEHQLVRLFWQGSATHEHDISLIYPSLTFIKDIAYKVQMVAAGYNESDVWERMISLYTFDNQFPYKIIHAEKIHSYYKAYEHADVALVPLRSSVFNSMKSNLKVLEAANAGIPALCSKVDSYYTMPVTYCSTPQQWAKEIRKMVQSKNKRNDDGANLQRFCDKFYNFNNINKERKQIFEYVAAKQTNL